MGVGRHARQQAGVTFASPMTARTALAGCQSLPVRTSNYFCCRALSSSSLRTPSLSVLFSPLPSRLPDKEDVRNPEQRRTGFFLCYPRSELPVYRFDEKAAKTRPLAKPMRGVPKPLHF